MLLVSCDFKPTAPLLRNYMDLVHEAQQHMNNYFTPVPISPSVYSLYVRDKPTNDIHLHVFMQSHNSTPINYTGTIRN